MHPLCSRYAPATHLPSLHTSKWKIRSCGACLRPSSACRSNDSTPCRNTHLLYCIICICCHCRRLAVAVVVVVEHISQQLSPCHQSCKFLTLISTPPLLHHQSCCPSAIASAAVSVSPQFSNPWRRLDSNDSTLSGPHCHRGFSSRRQHSIGTAMLRPVWGTRF